MLHKIWLVVLFCVAALLLAVFGAPKLLPNTLELETSTTNTNRSVWTSVAW